MVLYILLFSMKDVSVVNIHPSFNKKNYCRQIICRGCSVVLDVLKIIAGVRPGL
jgi:hypothetical protein